MCILIYSRISGKGQRLDKHLAAQILPLIKDQTTREICAQLYGGRFTEIVLLLIDCVGLSPGYQLDMMFSKTHLAYKDLKQLAMLLPQRKVQATHGQRICWELPRAISKGVLSASRSRGCAGSHRSQKRARRSTTRSLLW